MTLLSPLTGWALLLGFGAVTALMIRLGANGSGLSSTKDGYLLMNRDLGWVRGAFSIAATWIWAPALFVAATQGYLHGWVGVFWFTVPNVLCLILFGWFARRMRRMFPDGFTLSGAARQRYSPRVQVAYVVSLLTLSAASFAVQLLAGGLVVSVLTGIPFWMITIALAVIVLAYSQRSGLGASIVSDWLQMWVIGVVGVGLSLLVASMAGMDVIAAGTTGIERDYTSLVSGPGAALFWSFGLSTTIGLLSGPFGDQSFWQRGWAIREKDVGKSFVVGGLIFALVPLSMGLLGFAAAGAGLSPDDPQLTNMEAIVHWLPSWTVVLFLLYIFSGLASTLSSMLSSVSSLAGHDLGSTRWGARVDPVRRARVSMALLALVGLAIANVPGIAIVQLFIFYGTVRASVFVPTIVMLLWRRPLSEAGAFWGIVGALVVGLPASAYGNLTGNVPWIVGSSLLVIGCSGLGTVLGTVVETRRGTLAATHEEPEPVEVMGTDGRV